MLFCYLLGQIILIYYPDRLTYLIIAGVGFGGKFTRSFGVPDKVKFRFLSYIVSTLRSTVYEFYLKMEITDGIISYSSINRFLWLILHFWCCNKIFYRYSRFQSVGNITLHFPDNFGGDTTQIHYIGLKGEATQVLNLQNLFSSSVSPSQRPKIELHAVEEGCDCNHCLWNHTKSLRSQVSFNLSPKTLPSSFIKIHFTAEK